jgi:hypothetical protein
MEPKDKYPEALVRLSHVQKKHVQWINFDPASGRMFQGSRIAGVKVWLCRVAGQLQISSPTT